MCDWPEDEEWEKLSQEEKMKWVNPKRVTFYDIFIVAEFHPQYEVEYEAGEEDIQNDDILVKPWSDDDKEYTVLWAEHYIRPGNRKQGRLWIAPSSLMEVPGKGRRHLEDATEEDNVG